MPTTELHTHPKCNTLLNNIESPLTEKLPGNTNILLSHPYKLSKNKERIFIFQDRNNRKPLKSWELNNFLLNDHAVGE